MGTGVFRSFSSFALFLVSLWGTSFTAGCTVGTLRPGNGRVPHAATATGCADPLPVWIPIEAADGNPHEYASIVATMASIDGVTGIAASNYRCAYIQRARHASGLDEIEITFYHFTENGEISSPLSISFFGEPEEGTTYPVDLNASQNSPLVAAVALSGTAPLFTPNNASIATSGFIRFQKYPGAQGGPLEMVVQATLVSVGYNATGTPGVLSVSSRIALDY